MMNLEEIKDKRIAVLLSGGVDSSVVVYEFARLGLHHHDRRQKCIDGRLRAGLAF